MQCVPNSHNRATDFLDPGLSLMPPVRMPPTPSTTVVSLPCDVFLRVVLLPPADFAAGAGGLGRCALPSAPAPLGVPPPPFCNHSASPPPPPKSGVGVKQNLEGDGPIVLRCCHLPAADIGVRVSAASAPSLPPVLASLPNAERPERLTPAAMNMSGVLGLLLLPILPALPLLLCSSLPKLWSAGNRVLCGTILPTAAAAALLLLPPPPPPPLPLPARIPLLPKPLMAASIRAAGVAGECARPAASLMLSRLKALRAVCCGVFLFKSSVDPAAAAAAADFNSKFFNSQQICNGDRKGDENIARMLAVFASMVPLFLHGFCCCCCTPPVLLLLNSLSLAFLLLLQSLAADES